MASLRDELMIPFRGIGHAGRDLRAGSAVICKYMGRALRRALKAAWGAAWRGKTGADRLESLGIAALAGAVGLAVLAVAGSSVSHLAAPYGVAIACTAAAAWVVAAWTAAPQKTGPKPAERAPNAPTMSREEAIRIALLHFLDAHTRDRNGIHLAELHQKLTATAAFSGLPRARLTPLLEGHGVPVERSLSVDGIEGRSGVRRTVVEALLAALPSTEAPATEKPTESTPDLQESRPTLGPLSADSRAALGPVDALPAP
jgi:hypothetical protein